MPFNEVLVATRTMEKVMDAVPFIGYGTALLLALGLLFRRMFSTLSGENTVIKAMRDEIERLAATNVSLSVALSGLHDEIIKLRAENAILHGEIGALRNENSLLTKEVLQLNDQLKVWIEMSEKAADK